MREETLLDGLAQILVRSYWSARPALEQGLPDDVALAELFALVTTRSEMRARALSDMSLFARSFLPFGFGMEMRVADGAAIVPFEGWAQTIHPFEFVIRTSPTMDALTQDEHRMSIDRVALEEGVWRVVSVFDEPSRKRAELEVQLMAQMRRR